MDIPCLAKNLHHVGIAVRDLEGTVAFYQRLFGTPQPPVQELKDQGVRAVLVPLGSSYLEFFEPTDPLGPVARFLQRRGEGLHHICFEVDDLQEKLEKLAAAGLELVDKKPRQGLAGTIAFLQPRSTRGVLIELVQTTR